MITKKTYYAIQAVVFLAKRQNRPAHSAEISSTLNIPKHFLEKILTELSTAGILYVIKGRKGGYAIAENAMEVSVADILTVMNDRMISLPCVTLNTNQKCEDCLHKSVCGIGETFLQINACFLRKLGENSLQVLIGNSVY